MHLIVNISIQLVLSYLNSLVISVYAVAISPSVNHVHRKISRHREQK